MRLLGFVVVALALAAPASTSTGAPPALRLASEDPFVVTGRSFGASERVRLVVTRGNERRLKVVVAGPAGGFRVRLAFAARSCTLVLVSATGSLGSRAVLRILPACQPPLVP